MQTHLEFIYILKYAVTIVCFLDFVVFARSNCRGLLHPLVPYRLFGIPILHIYSVIDHCVTVQHLFQSKMLKCHVTVDEVIFWGGGGVKLACYALSGKYTTFHKNVPSKELGIK